MLEAFGVMRLGRLLKAHSIDAAAINGSLRRRHVQNSGFQIFRTLTFSYRGVSYPRSL